MQVVLLLSKVNVDESFHLCGHMWFTSYFSAWFNQITEALRHIENLGFQIEFFVKFDYLSI